MHAKQGGVGIWWPVHERRRWARDVAVNRDRVIGDGSVRPVTVGELNRHTSSVIAFVTDGERLIVTRHRDPKAVVLGLRDAMEILAAPAFPELAAAARRDIETGATLEPWPNLGPVGIALADAAAQILNRLGARDRGGLKRGLCHGDADAERPRWLQTSRWLAPFSYEGDSTVLVHALIDARALEREVIGEEVWQRRLRRDLDRHAHSRVWQERS